MSETSPVYQVGETPARCANPPAWVRDTLEQAWAALAGESAWGELRVTYQAGRVQLVRVETTVKL